MPKKDERTTAALALLLDAFSTCAAPAAQQLIPTPYPELLGPNAEIGGGVSPTHRHQHLIPEPVPQSLGPNALGNPKPWHHHRHQHLLPAPYWRQYHHWR
ncbi:MAG TPA: hypothetical protein VL996_13825 [Methylocella sp.]|nr:hypothetical protein [Methylocella sp.]